MAHREQEHIDEIATLKKNHADESALLRKNHTDEMASLKKRLAAEMENQRVQYEAKINETEMSLRQCQQTIVRLESTVLELNTRLTKKTDVEKQRDEWKAHHDSMEAAKRELQV